MVKLNDLYKKLNHYEYVSFDLFDTLMFRSVPKPSDVFDVVQKEFNRKHPNDSINNFKQTRIKAESRARRKNKYKEITINDIYYNIKNRYREELKRIEKKVEIDYIVPNVPMISILNKLKKNGKYIVITTDMYLDRDTIETILCKLEVHYDRLFISSEEGKTKLEGDLFYKILDELKIEPSQIAHTGDNHFNDIKIPKQIGIESFERVLDATYNGNFYLPNRNIDLVLFNEKIKRNINVVGNNQEYRIGATIVGPLLYFFCKWIHKKVTSVSADNIAFVSREGYLIKKVYDELYPNENTQYISLNKNLVRLPSLYISPTVETFIKTIPYREKYTWNELLDLLFCNNKERVLSKCHLDGMSSINRKNFNNKEFHAIFDKVIELNFLQIENQYKLFLNYISKNNFVNKHTLLVNNSINGNTQKLFEEIVSYSSVKADVFGIQFYASKKCKKLLWSRYASWFDEMSVDIFKKETFAQYSVVFEHLLFEQKGTALQYEYKQDDVVVQNAEIGMEKLNSECISNIQKYVIDFAKLAQKKDLDIPVELVIENFFEFLINPYKDDAKTIGKLYDVDYCGISRIIDAPVDSNNLVECLKNAKNYDRVKWPYAYFALCKNEKLLKVFYKIYYKIKYRKFESNK